MGRRDVDIEIRILGPLEVRHGEEPLSLPGGRAQALLALLAIRADTVVSTDRLIDQLWGESPPPTARTKLHGLVSALRKRLAASGESELIKTHPPGYALAVDTLAVDAHRFRRMVEQARQSAPAEKAETLRLALDLWRGPALSDFVYEPFAQAEIMTLEELRLQALEERIDADLALGRHGDLVAELQRLVAENPLRERLAGLLMLAMYRGGRQADALAVYRDTRRYLVEELGVEPGPDLQRLETQILAQDDALTLKSPVAGAVERPAAWLSERRKPVTVAFVGLTPTDARADAEVSRYAIEAGYRTVEAIIHRHGGTVQGLLGDVAVAVFGVPTAHEDDAHRAARAAIEIRRNLGPEVVLRIGINTGDVVVGGARNQPSGTTVSLAGRLLQAAAQGEILIGSATRRLLGEAAVSAPSSFGGEDGSMPSAWRLVDVVDFVARPAPMIGRERELKELQTAFDQALHRDSPVLIEVTGEAGIGKSRLVQEFVSELDDGIQVLTGHCPAYGEGITFWPLREMVLEAAAHRGLDDVRELETVPGMPAGAVTQVAGAAGLLEYDGDPWQLFSAVCEFFQALGRLQPLVLVVEDLHWSEPTFRDLLRRLVGESEGFIFLICLTRSESLDDREGDEDGALRRRMDLPPLGSREVERLARNRSGGKRLTDDTVQHLVETVRGNPLFAEQTVAALDEDEEATLPLSIQALLAARLDRLGPAERDVVRSAAVLGTEFSRPALAGLLPGEAQPFLERHIRALEDKRLLAATQRQFLGEPALAFNHILTQAAAYRSLTRRDRSRLHEQAANWLESTSGEASLDEVIGYHLERAHRDRTELGADDEKTRVLARRAGERLGRAGLRAYSKFDITAAENLLARSKTLLPQEHPDRYSVMRRLAETYPVMGRLEDADAAFAELLETIDRDEELARSLRLERIRIGMIAGPDPMTLQAVQREAEEAMSAYAAAGDETGMSQACYVLAFVHQRAGRIADLERVAWDGLAHARRSDRREEVGALWYVPAAMVLGPTPVATAITACEELLLAHGQDHPGVLSDLAQLHAMQGDFDRARQLVASAHDDLVERFRGVRRALTFIAQRGARVEILAGDLVAAERHLRWALELASEVGERDQVAQLAGTLTKVSLRSGNLEEATGLVELSREESPAESVVSQALWRAAWGLVLAWQEEWAEARRLAREAMAWIPRPMFDLRAELLRDLAEVLARSGATERAAEASNEAAALYRQKGNVVGAAAASAVRTDYLDRSIPVGRRGSAAPPPSTRACD